MEEALGGMRQNELTFFSVFPSQQRYIALQYNHELGGGKNDYRSPRTMSITR